MGGFEGVSEWEEGEGVSEWEEASSEWAEEICCGMVLYERVVSKERCKDHRAI